MSICIGNRKEKIEEFSHFGDCKNIDEDLSELRWKNGRRIYFAKLNGMHILFLTGGSKNDQKKKIKEARRILARENETG